MTISSQQFVKVHANLNWREETHLDIWPPCSSGNYRCVEWRQYTFECEELDYGGNYFSYPIYLCSLFQMWRSFSFWILPLVVSVQFPNSPLFLSSVKIWKDQGCPSSFMETLIHPDCPGRLQSTTSFQKSHVSCWQCVELKVVLKTHTNTGIERVRGCNNIGSTIWHAVGGEVGVILVLHNVTVGRGRCQTISVKTTNNNM